MKMKQAIEFLRQRLKIVVWSIYAVLTLLVWDSPAWRIVGKSDNDIYHRGFFYGGLSLSFLTLRNESSFQP
jgi:hypothetical protein